MRRSGTLLLAVALALASILLQWLGTGGTNPALSRDDARVMIAMQFAATSKTHGYIVQTGELQKAWLTTTDSGYEVHLGVIASPEYSYHFTVSFAEEGSPTSLRVDLWRGVMFPRYLGYLSVGILGIWLLRSFIFPLFMQKCPDCPPNLLNPPVTVVRETTVYSGGFDKEGNSLAPIVRRDYVCPRCHYVKVTYLVAGDYRPGRMWRGAFLAKTGFSGPAGDLDWYQKALDHWHADNQIRGQFQAYEDWKAFWEELKASEHEERHSRPV